MEPGPGVDTLWESCSGRKDNPRDVGLAEGQREGKRQTGGGVGWSSKKELLLGWLKLRMLGGRRGGVRAKDKKACGLLWAPLKTFPSIRPCWGQVIPGEVILESGWVTGCGWKQQFVCLGPEMQPSF